MGPPSSFLMHDPRILGRTVLDETAHRLGGRDAGKRRRDPAVAADLIVEVGGRSYIFESKRQANSGLVALEAVHEAIRSQIRTMESIWVLHARMDDVSEVVASVVARLPDVVRERKQALTERNIDALVDVYLGVDPLAAAMPAIEDDNARAQAAFLRKWKVLTAEQVAEQAQHVSSNRSATASRWKREKRIFAVRVKGREAYPEFQFREGRPIPTVGKVLRTLPESMSGWQTAFWFTSPNGWLDDRTPLESLRDETALVAAAEREHDVWAG